MSSVPPTLADLTYFVAVELKSAREGVTDVASIDAIIDTAGRLESDDYWNTGPALILDTPTGSVPQGEYGVVSDFGSGTVTLRSNWSATVPVGSTYALGRRRYPLDLLAQCVNAAYRDLGKIPLVDITSLTTLQSTTQYTIPAAARKDLREVWIQTIMDIPDSLGWHEIPHGTWRQENALLFLPQLSLDRALKLVYIDESPQLVDYNDVLSPFVHPKRIIYKAAAHALLWRSEKLNPAAQSQYNQKVNYFLDQDLRAQNDHEIVMPPKRGKSHSLRSWMKSSSKSEDSFQGPWNT